ncbi:TPA: hypothetical protein ACH3X1_001226 [Trebouxia sp. C0004]
MDQISRASTTADASLFTGIWQRWPRGPKESAELYPLVWNGMHVQPYPSTQTIKQQILVYAECTSDSEFKSKFAPDLVGKNSVPSLMTSLLNKANRYFSKNVRGKAASAVREMATQVYGRMADDSRDRSTMLQSLTTGEVLSPIGTSANCFETTSQGIF